MAVSRAMQIEESAARGFDRFQPADKIWVSPRSR
jgi:hypothetical protein